MASALVVAGLVALADPASSQDKVRFIGVNLDPKTVEADKALCKLLTSNGIETVPSAVPVNYGDSIDAVISPGECPDYVARLTPYACVVAEMRGATFTILATYQSVDTGALTYRSYFVVKKDGFLKKREPTLSDLIEHMKRFKVRAESRGAGEEPEQPLRFIYHNQYSTSSFFLPSLVFREARLFTAGKPGGAAPFVAKKNGESSGDLVRAVAAGSADLAAVWDGTKSDIERNDARLAAQVDFIPIGMVVPNDLLVCARCMEGSLKLKIGRAAVSKEINKGDFKVWTLWDAAPDARSGYSSLKRRAAERPASVSVQVENKTGSDEWAEATRQAIRLSGTEFTVHDDDSDGQRVDAVWRLAPIHDEAVTLTTSIKGVDLIKPQTFVISFSGREDLTRRIAAIIHSGMHRFRYIWPYQRAAPTIIRDIDFPATPGDPAVVQRVTSQDGQTSGIVEEHFAATVDSADPHVIRLKSPGFELVNAEYSFDPMSEVSYRVILQRPTTEDPILRWFTIALLVLSGLCAAAAIYDLRRGRGPLGS